MNDNSKLKLEASLLSPTQVRATPLFLLSQVLDPAVAEQGLRKGDVIKAIGEWSSKGVRGVRVWILSFSLFSLLLPGSMFWPEVRLAWCR